MIGDTFHDFAPVTNQQPVMGMGHTNFVTNPSRKAVLFLLSQVDIPDQARRAHLYNFDANFRMDLNDTIERQIIRHTPAAELEAIMLGSQAAKSSIIPSAEAQIINTQSFHERWTFILVSDNDNGVDAIGTVKTVPSRMLYSGYVDGEPVTQGMGGQNVFNPSAIYSTTHHLTLSAYRTFSPLETAQRVETTGDFSYIDGILAQNVTMNGLQLYNIAPHMVAKSIVSDPQSAQAYNISAAPVQAYRESIEVPTELGNPSFHLSNIVNGLTATKRTMSGGQDLGSIDIFAGNDLFMGNFASIMTPPANAVVNQLNPRVPFTFQQLQQQFGDNLDIVVLRQPKGMQVDLADPFKPTPRNIFTTILSGAVPGLLAQFGLAEIAFAYDSYARVEGGLGSTNGERGLFNVFSAASLFPVANSMELKAMIDNFMYYMKYTVWPIILSNTSHFRVNMHCSLAGASLVDLNFYDNISEPGYVHSSNLLGGINSPLLGTSGDLYTNAGLMMEVINDVRSNGGIGDLPMGGNNLPIF